MELFQAIVKVYPVPPSKNGRYYLRDWDVKHPLFSCFVVVDPDEGDPSEKLQIKLEAGNGDIIATSFYNGETGVYPVADSPRHYVLVLSNKLLRAEVGVGFEESGDSIDFSLAIQKYMRRRLDEMRLGSTYWPNRLVNKMDANEEANHDEIRDPILSAGKVKSSQEDLVSEGYCSTIPLAQEELIEEFGEFQ